jgi:hypothetical protein
MDKVKLGVVAELRDDGGVVGAEEDARDPVHSSHLLHLLYIPVPRVQG